MIEKGPRATLVTAVDAPVAVPRKLEAMLLPGEHVTFGSSPHPAVFAQPLVLAVVAGVVSAVVLRQPWIANQAEHVAALAVAGLLEASQLLSLVKRAARYAGLRVVSTNRRVFVVRGVLVRRVTPLGNRALAASTMSQGILGRMLGYGNIDLPLADGTPGTFHDMRDPIRLYREFQAVANGVDGDTWTPAVRQTIIP